MKIKYYDLIAPGGLHSEINVALLKTFMFAKSEYSSVEFYAEKDHAEICKNKLNDPKIRFYSLCLLPKKIFGGFKTPLRDVLGCLYVLKAFLFSNRNDVLIFGLAFPLSQNLISILNKYYNRAVFVCLHGELEVFVKDTKFNRNKKYYSLLKFAINKNTNNKYILLGESIFNHVKHIFKSNTQLIIIDHPYIYNQTNILNTNFDPLVVGQIGGGDFSKGSHLLFELSENLQKEIKEGKLKITLVGKMSPKLLAMDNGLVSYSKEVLPPSLFKEQIQNLHYTLQLRDNNIGKATASGSFFDSIKYEKPFISLNSDFIRFYSEQYEDCGKIVGSIDEIAQEIRLILLNKTIAIEDYKKSVLAIQHMQQELSIENIARKLKPQL